MKSPFNSAVITGFDVSKDLLDVMIFNPLITEFEEIIDKTYTRYLSGADNE